jgi:hypothetical protein
MSRDLTSVVDTALTADTIEPFFAVDLLFDSPDQVYLWTGIGDKTINSKTYKGAGELLGISSIEESADIYANGCSLILNGQDSTLLSRALTSNYNGRVAKIYFGVMSNPSDYVEIFCGFIDQMVVNEAAEGTSITLTIENKLVSLERPSNLRSTAEYLKQDYPNDKGLEFLESIQTTRINWGA